LRPEVGAEWCRTEAGKEIARGEGEVQEVKLLLPLLKDKNEEQ
jgi:hypothetical protein